MAYLRCKKQSIARISREIGHLMHMVGRIFMHNSCIETVITVTGTEVTIWESMYANDFAHITVDQGGKQKKQAKKIPDLSVLAAEKSKMQKKSPKLGVGIIDPQHYGTIGF